MYQAFERFDLKTQSTLFESTWIEISNKHSKNIICGCIYRHPSTDTSDFLSSLEFILKKLSDENKEIYLCGDYNIDLLKINENNNNLKFYNLLASFGYLPSIITPREW